MFDSYLPRFCKRIKQTVLILLTCAFCQDKKVLDTLIHKQFTNTYLLKIFSSMTSAIYVYRF